jgi:hypothetical protein
MALAEAHQVSRVAIVTAIHRSGGSVRSLSEANRRYSLREDAFDDASTDDRAAYWLGFGLADGANSGKAYKVALHVQDVGHLEKLRRFLGTETRTIRSVPGKPHRYIQFHSVDLCAALSEWGVGQKKSLTAAAHPALEDNPHFWRGVVDGDGNIRLYRKDAGEPGEGGVSVRLEVGFPRSPRGKARRCGAEGHAQSEGVEASRVRADSGGHPRAPVRG